MTPASHRFSTRPLMAIMGLAAACLHAACANSCMQAWHSHGKAILLVALFACQVAARRQLSAQALLQHTHDHGSTVPTAWAWRWTTRTRSPAHCNDAHQVRDRHRLV